MKWICANAISWNVGTCFLGGTLSPREFLPKSQKSLEKLSLIRDGTCEAYLIDTIDFTEFCHLKSLSWIGMSRRDYFWSFGEFVQKNKLGVESLQSLSLDFIDCLAADYAWYEYEKATREGFPYRPANFFAEIVLKILPEGPERKEDAEGNKLTAILSKSLNTLSLSVVSSRMPKYR
jgi:hypothetical protein